MPRPTRETHELRYRLQRYAESRGIDARPMTSLQAIDDVNELRRTALRMQRTAERRCNGVIKSNGFAGWDDADEAKAEREDQRNEARIRAIVARLYPCGSIVADFSGDPRGAMVKIGTPHDIETGSYLGV